MRKKKVLRRRKSVEKKEKKGQEAGDLNHFMSLTKAKLSRVIEKLEIIKNQVRN